MNDRKMIVISVEGLAASALGCYGASWNETPAIDLLASRGCVWDRAIAEHDDGLKVLADWLAPPPSHDPDHWIARWNERGPVELITDDPRLSQQSLDNDFDQTWLIESDPPDVDTLPAEEIEETHLASLFAGLFARIEDPDPAALWWLHTQSLVRSWDAPRWLVPLDADELYAGEPSEELDLLPETDVALDEADCEMPPWVFPDVVPPQLKLTEHSHPDLAVAWMRTYGCQVRLLDRMLALLLEYAADWDPIVVLVGTSGFSLGQNQTIGYRAGPLRSCHHRVPMIVSDLGPLREKRVVNAKSLATLLAKIKMQPETLIDPAGWASSDSEFEPRVITRDDKGSVAVTTSRWYHVQDADQQDRLYLKPDDLEDQNDVSRLRPDIVDLLGE
ncbi:hypothetical protein [Novipirellula rosea]|uniref:Sulfatase n=1 Tax=Novipirellula rosea TaxID=1031540 RepID=A0ABP8MQT4_9BACT|tara:strand:+ start:567 stop:1733 length:1167 start_codon:yes stop_codon:yes gene_type:complete